MNTCKHSNTKLGERNDKGEFICGEVLGKYKPNLYGGKGKENGLAGQWLVCEGFM